MKYSISKEKLNSLILKYISEEYIPDYGWGDSYQYKEDMDRWGEVEFYVNDVSRYSYYKSFKGYNNILVIRKGIVDKLTDMFGNLWVPVFANWFSENTSLPIQSVGTYETWDVRILS